MGKVSEAQIKELLASKYLMGLEDDNGCRVNIPIEGLIEIIKENFKSNVDLFYNGIANINSDPDDNSIVEKSGFWIATDKGKYVNYGGVENDSDLSIISVDENGVFHIKTVVHSFEGFISESFENAKDILIATIDDRLNEFQGDLNNYKTELNNVFVDFKAEMHQIVESDFKGTISPTDPAPTEVGSYKPTIAGVYANLGGIEALAGYDTLFYFNGTTWSKSEVELPKNKFDKWIPKDYSIGEQVFNNGVIYESSNDVTAAEIPGESDKWQFLNGNSVIQFKKELAFTGGELFGEHYEASSFIGAKIHFSIEGDLLIVRMVTNPAGGIVHLLKDNIQFASIDTYNQGSNVIKDFYFKLDKIEATEITLLNSQDKNPASSGNSIAFVSARYTTSKGNWIKPSLDQIITLESIDYNGSWVKSEYSGSSTGTIFVSKVINSELKFNFSGNRLNLFFLKNHVGATFKLYINNNLEATIDTFHPAGQGGGESLFFSKKLPLGKYEVKIVHAGEDGEDLQFCYASYSNDLGVIQESKSRKFGEHCEDWGIKGDYYTDNTAAFQRMIDFLSTVQNSPSKFHSSTIYFPAGYYRITDKIQIGRDGIIYAPRSTQNPIKLVGEGMNATGKWYLDEGSTIFMCVGQTNGDAVILTRGTGFLEMEGITMLSVGCKIPFIKTTYTTSHIHNCAFIESDPNFHRENAIVDAIILGGNEQYESLPVIDDAGFQGYGTVIRDNFFNGVRRAVYGKVFANGVSVCNNTIWRGCGGECAIEFDYTNPMAAQKNAGGNISGNLIEMDGYRYGIKIGACEAFSFLGNNFYDPGEHTIACYLLTEKASRNRIIPGHIASGFYPCLFLEDNSSTKNNAVIWGEPINGNIASYKI